MPASHRTGVDRAVIPVTATAVALLAAISAAISYAHMLRLADAHGEAGWQAHTLPLSVDGLEAVASLVLVADHRTGRRPGLLPWLALAAGTTASLAANVAVAEPTAVGRAISAWPAVAFLIALKLTGRLLDRPATDAVRNAPEPAPNLPDAPRPTSMGTAVWSPALRPQAVAWCRAERDEQGRWPTGDRVAQQWGCTDRTGRKIVRTARNAVPEPLRKSPEVRAPEHCGVPES
jgi:hypothetical protein